MATKADFYIGRGPDAEWIGSMGWDGYPKGVKPEILQATSEEAFRKAVTSFLGFRGDGVLPEAGWPWKWDDSSKTNYSYAFDSGEVWICCFGSSWWRAKTPEPDHTRLKRKSARFPDMTRIPEEIALVADEDFDTSP